RLFYVAITRAKENVYMSYYKYKDNGNRSAKLRFLQDEPNNSEKADVEQSELDQAKQEVLAEMPKTKQVLADYIGVSKNLKLETEEKALLQPVLENYQLSVTHLNNFLNVAEGGPEEFLEKNLLRFPQPKPKPAKFGSAMHAALERFYSKYKDTDELPSQEELLDIFKIELNKEELTKSDFEDLLDKGHQALSVYYKQKKDEFSVDDWVEFSFRNQGIKVGNAHLRGKIDKMREKENNLIKVYDFKTGSALDNWKGRGKFEKIKAWRYRNQLVFYKLLVENSRKFGNKFRVNTGQLEFLEPEDEKIKEMSLQIDQKEVDRLSRLAQIVFKKVQNLNFPDISKYSDNIKGIKAFEEDLLEEN
ncbi:MAG: hypothetical protein BRC22_00630, partial [Parcubacteria group bacterium QH_9_35_7]